MFTTKGKTIVGQVPGFQEAVELLRQSAAIRTGRLYRDSHFCYRLSRLEGLCPDYRESNTRPSGL
jgi:hypothetical protein